MMETLIKKQSIKSQMLRWSFLSLVSIGILTSCNKEEIKKQENVLPASVEQQQPTKFKVHFEGEVYTMYVKDLENFDCTYKELNNPKINELAAKQSLHTVQGLPNEKGMRSTDLYLFGSEVQADSKLDELMSSKFVLPARVDVAYRAYQNPNYGGNSQTMYLHNLQTVYEEASFHIDLVPTITSIRARSYKYISGNRSAIKGVYFFTGPDLNGRVFRVGLPDIPNAVTSGVSFKSFFAGSNFNYDNPSIMWSGN